MIFYSAEKKIKSTLQTKVKFLFFAPSVILLLEKKFSSIYQMNLE